MAWGRVEEGQWHLATETLSGSRPEGESMITYRAFLEEVHPRGESEEAKRESE